MSTNVHPRARNLLIAFVLLPLVTVAAVWLWIRSERSKLKDRGLEACAASGRTPEACHEMAERNHERCVELTFTPKTRTSGAQFDERGYVECLEIGSDAYWKESARRAAARKSERTP